MTKAREIWVLPETTAEGALSPSGGGLLTEARKIGELTGRRVFAVILTEDESDFSGIFGSYGIPRARIFVAPLFHYPSPEAYAAALLPWLEKENPWLVLLADTPFSHELAAILAGRLDTGAVIGCVRFEFSSPERPVFYRPIYNGQLHQEIEFQTDHTMPVTMDPAVLEQKEVEEPAVCEVTVVRPEIDPASLRIEHLEYLPSDYRTVDISEADTVVAAGMGAIPDDLYPLVEELADLLEGAIGTTRPVVDTGKIPRERMIGQTGKVVGPGFYLALGVSGASHHVGGIQASRRIVSINRDPQAPIFRASDTGAAADLREVLPKLIERIRNARANGEIL